MQSSELEQFIAQMDQLVAQSDDPHVVAKGTGAALVDLLAGGLDVLNLAYRQPATDGYRQHLVHVHPDARYSIVSLVWRPGQATPIHDHRCWCVVGVLDGHEREVRYHLYDEEGGGHHLHLDGEVIYAAGSVCELVPPDEDIHKVENADSSGITVSIHVYGDDIGAVGSSINRLFTEPVAHDETFGTRVSWREAAPLDPEEIPTP